MIGALGPGEFIRLGLLPPQQYYGLIGLGDNPAYVDPNAKFPMDLNLTTLPLPQNPGREGHSHLSNFRPNIYVMSSILSSLKLELLLNPLH